MTSKTTVETNYQEELRRKQKEHLDRVSTRTGRYFSPCMHDSCSECVGTGIKHNGSFCVHSLSCPCPKCSPSSLSV